MITENDGLFVMTSLSLFLSLSVLDVDECKGAHGCSYQCMNSAGSYQCVCADGFSLAEDRRSCLSLCALPSPTHPTVASQSDVDSHLSTNNNRGETFFVIIQEITALKMYRVV